MKTVSILYRGAYVLLSCYALLLWLGVFDGAFTLDTAMFYTTQSNILCCIFSMMYFTLTILDTTGRPANPFPRIKGAVTLCIAVTGLLFVLLPGPSQVSFESKILHYICPVMVFLDYLLFDEKGKYKATDPVAWLAIPIAYVVYALVRGAVGGEIGDTGSNYPYPFLDPTPSGAGNQMLLYVGMMIAAFLMLGYLIYFLDRQLGQKRRRIWRRRI